MNAQDEYIQLKDIWRNRILSSFYIVVGIIFLAEIVMFFYMYFMKNNFIDDTIKYITLYIAVPTLINLGCIKIAQRIQDENDNELVKSYAVVGCLLVICTVICTIHSFFLISSAAFVTPIVVSCILDDVKITKVSGICSVVLLILTAISAPIFDDYWNSSERWYNVMGSLVLLAVVYYICRSISNYVKEKNDIIYQMSLAQERMHMALKKDAMTDLFNHSEFYHSLDESVIWCHNHNEPISVAVIDVDLFKSVNDTYGHENGDIVLIKIAEILRENCTDKGKAFRYGGEEFALILEGATKEETFEIVETIRKMICEIKFGFMHDRHCSISSGIYQFNGDNMTCEDIFNKADEAMYQAKQNGRNQTICALE